METLWRNIRTIAPVFILPWVLLAFTRAEDTSSTPPHRYFIDCSASVAGDGSSEHPWNSLALAQGHPFVPDDRIALARGTVCSGTFSPQGSGREGHSIRLTAYGHGRRPRIVATRGDRQVLLLFNQEYWLVDSLDLSGANMYGVFASGDKGTLHRIYLENLFVHDVVGGAMKHKDNGLVVVGPSSLHVFFDDVLVDGVIAAHTNQWVGILIGGGPFPYPPDAPLNSHVTVRNSSVQDVYGDGIVLFRDSDGLIETSTAWQTGMQPTETIGTPNAIWTWTCTDCTVRDNEAFLTDSPGVDGGAYDIDWDNTRNTVERNYAHDTQGYCFAVFAAGYVTSESVVRDNLCIDNGLSPRLAALQGAVYLHTWNGGVIRGLRMEHNTLSGIRRCLRLPPLSATQTRETLLPLLLEIGSSPPLQTSIAATRNSRRLKTPIATMGPVKRCLRLATSAMSHSQLFNRQVSSRGLLSKRDQCPLIERRRSISTPRLTSHLMPTVCSPRVRERS